MIDSMTNSTEVKVTWPQVKVSVKAFFLGLALFLVATWGFAVGTDVWKSIFGTKWEFAALVVWVGTVCTYLIYISQRGFGKAKRRILQSRRWDLAMFVAAG